METIIRFTKHSVVLFAMILSNAVLYGGPVYAMADGEDISVGDVFRWREAPLFLTHSSLLTSHFSLHTSHFTLLTSHSQFPL